MKNWLRRALIEFLGIDKLRDQVIDVDTDVGRLENFVGFPTTKIRAGIIRANTITADKIKMENHAPKGLVEIPPIEGRVFKTRGGDLAGPMCWQGENCWGVAGWADTWDDLGRHASGTKGDLIALMPVWTADWVNLNRTKTKSEPTPPWKYTSAEGRDLSSVRADILTEVINKFEDKKLFGSANIVRDMRDA